MRKLSLTGFLILTLLFTGVTTAFAQDEPPAEGDETTDETVSGTIIDVNEEDGTVTILTEDGEEVTIQMSDGDYDHPIVSLFDEYFGTSIEDLADALDALADAGLEDEDGNPVEGTVTSVEEVTDEDGNTTWEVTVVDEDGNETVVVIDDEEQAGDLSDALNAVSDVSFDVSENEDGDPVATSVGDEVAEYHDDGLGFGVLVKFYAIAEESLAACEENEDAENCDVTVEELVELFQSGTGLGQIFKIYGKPSLMGVGHIRQALAGGDDGGSGDGGDGGDGSSGICNARANGGNANANGQDVDCD